MRMPVAEDSEHKTAVVFVVDDDASVREALSSLLRAVGWQVKTFESAAEFLVQPVPVGAACLVLDVRLPGVSGLELQRVLAERGDALPIIFITGHGDIPMSVHAMKAGAVEFLPKPFRERELLDAIELALERDAASLGKRREVADIRERIALLSDRERQVMDLVVKGLLNKQVAAELGIVEITVKVHRRRVMQKLGVSSLPELVRLVVRAQRVSA
jgi:FixJ family two-component response regulator